MTHHPLLSFMPQRQPRGGAMAMLLVALVAFVIGAVAVTMLRQYGVDVLTWIKPQPKAAEAAAEAEPVLTHRDTRVKSANEKELLALIDDVKQQRKSVKEREKALVEHETSLKEKEQTLYLFQKQVEEASDHLKQARIEINESEKPTLKKMAKLWSQMETDSVVFTIVNTPDNLDMSAKILSNMQDRQVVPILNALAVPQNKKISADLIQKLQQIRTSSTPASTPEASS